MATIALNSLLQISPALCAPRPHRSVRTCAEGSSYGESLARGGNVSSTFSGLRRLSSSGKPRGLQSFAVKRNGHDFFTGRKKHTPPRSSAEDAPVGGGQSTAPVEPTPPSGAEAASSSKGTSSDPGSGSGRGSGPAGEQAARQLDRDAAKVWENKQALMSFADSAKYKAQEEESLLFRNGPPPGDVAEVEAFCRIYRLAEQLHSAVMEALRVLDLSQLPFRQNPNPNSAPGINPGMWAQTPGSSSDSGSEESADEGEGGREGRRRGRNGAVAETDAVVLPLGSPLPPAGDIPEAEERIVATLAHMGTMLSQWRLAVLGGAAGGGASPMPLSKVLQDEELLTPLARMRGDLREACLQLQNALEAALPEGSPLTTVVKRKLERLKNVCLDAGFPRTEGAPAHADIPNFAAVRLKPFRAGRSFDPEGDVQFWRGGQVTEEGLDWLLEKGFRSVVDLRAGDGAHQWIKPAVETQQASGRIKLFRLPVVYKAMPSDVQVEEFARLVADPANQPLYLHSQGGVGRACAMVARWRELVLRGGIEAYERSLQKNAAPKNVTARPFSRSSYGLVDGVKIVTPKVMPNLIKPKPKPPPKRQVAPRQGGRGAGGRAPAGVSGSGDGSSDRRRADGGASAARGDGGGDAGEALLDAGPSVGGEVDVDAVATAVTRSSLRRLGMGSNEVPEFYEPSDREDDDDDDDQDDDDDESTKRGEGGWIAGGPSRDAEETDRAGGGQAAAARSGQAKEKSTPLGNPPGRQQQPQQGLVLPRNALEAQRPGPGVLSRTGMRAFLSRSRVTPSGLFKASQGGRRGSAKGPSPAVDLASGTIAGVAGIWGLAGPGIPRAGFKEEEGEGEGAERAVVDLRGAGGDETEEENESDEDLELTRAGYPEPDESDEENLPGPSGQAQGGQGGDEHEQSSGGSNAGGSRAAEGGPGHGQVQGEGEGGGGEDLAGGRGSAGGGEEEAEEGAGGSSRKPGSAPASLLSENGSVPNGTPAATAAATATFADDDAASSPPATAAAAPAETAGAGAEEEVAYVQGDMCASTTGVVRLQSRRKAEMYLVRTDGFSCTREKVKESTLAFTHPSTQQQMLMWKTPPKTVLLLKKLGDELLDEAQKVAAWLHHQEGMNIVVEPELHDRFARIPGFGFVQTYYNQDTSKLHERVDFVVCLGGDGVILHASNLFRNAVPPVVSFNLGSLGFLTAHPFEEFKQDLRAIIHGNSSMDGVYIILRMRLRCELFRDGKPLPGKVFEVLNEVVVDRGSNPYLCKIECYERNRLITKVQADGVIVATPTGSTAYSTAAGGSIVHPNVPAMLFTPICPHSLSFRPVILPDSALLELKVPRDARNNAWVSFDGKKRQQLSKGDSVRVCMSEHPMPTVNKSDQTDDWFRSLVRCLNWNERMEQKALIISP